MLSKAKGLILCVAGVLHVLFNLGSDTSISKEIPTEVLKAAENFVNMQPMLQGGVICKKLF